MKALQFFLGLVLAASLSAKAQVDLPLVSSNLGSTKQLFKTDKNIVLWSESANSQIISIYNNKFQLQESHSFKSEKHAYFKDLASAGDFLYTYTIFDDIGRICKFNLKGKLIKEIKLEDDSYNKFRTVDLAAHEDMLFVGRHVKQEKKGYEISAFGPDFVQKWTTSFVPDKGSSELYMMEANSKGIRILDGYAKNFFASNSPRILGLSLSGEKLFEKEAEEAPDKNGTYRFRQMAINSKGQCLIVAEYGKGKNSNKEMPGGLHFHLVGANGSFEKVEALSFEDNEESLLPFQSVGGFTEAPGIVVADIFTEGNNFRLVGESYYYVIEPINSDGTTTGSKNADYYRLDIIDISITSSGELSWKKIAKPYQHFYFENFMAMDFEDIYDNLNNYRGFAAQVFHKDKYFFEGNHMGFNYFGQASIDANYENLDERKYLSTRPNTGTQKAGLPSFTIKKPQFNENRFFMYSGMIGFESHYLVYNLGGEINFQIKNY